MNEINKSNENSKSDEDKNPIVGYYLNQSLYSRNPEKIFEKVTRLKAEGGYINLTFKGSLKSELSECIKNPNTDEGVKGIKNVLSFSLMELYSSVGNENFKEKIEKTKEIVGHLLDEYKKDFFLLFTPEHDVSTIIHSLNVMALALYTRQYVVERFPDDDFLKIATLEEFALAGLLHDTGKIYMEDIILKTEKLTDEDWIKIRKHPKDGYEILKKAGITSDKILNAVLYHHMRLDGSGYPGVETGDSILPLTYLIGIVDSLEAITSKSRRHNVNKKEASMEEAIEIIFRDTKEKRSYPVDFFNIVANALLSHDQDSEN